MTPVKPPKKDLDPIIKGSFVLIPVGKKGCVFENGEHVLYLLNQWLEENPDKIITGTPSVNITPSSAGRMVSIDSILIMWKYKD